MISETTRKNVTSNKFLMYRRLWVHACFLYQRNRPECTSSISRCHKALLIFHHIDLYVMCRQMQSYSHSWCLSFMISIRDQLDILRLKAEWRPDDLLRQFIIKLLQCNINIFIPALHNKTNKLKYLFVIYSFKKN